MDQLTMDRLTLTIIGGFIAYLFSKWRDRQLEIFKLKSHAYKEFLKTFELSLPDEDGKKIKNSDHIRALNNAIGELTIYAPNSVIREIKKVVDERKLLDRGAINKIKPILHNDLYSKLYFLGRLDSQDILWFPFQIENDKSNQ